MRLKFITTKIMNKLTPACIVMLLAGCAGGPPSDFNSKLTESLRILSSSPLGQPRTVYPQAAPVYVVNPAPQPIPHVPAPIPSGLTQKPLQSQLTGQYFQNYDQMCRYSDGTVVNIGVGVCALWR